MNFAVPDIWYEPAEYAGGDKHRQGAYSQNGHTQRNRYDKVV